MPLANPTSFSYTAPSTNTDGSILKPEDILKYQIGLGTVSGDYSIIKDDVGLEPGTNQTTPFNLLGTLAFGRWFAAVRTVSQAGIMSPWSAEISFDLVPPIPSAPTNFSVA